MVSPFLRLRVNPPARGSLRLLDPAPSTTPSSFRDPTPPLSLFACAGFAALVFLVSAPLFYLVYSRLPVLYDADGYYHLAVARAYAERGIFHTLDWARFSVMHDGFGDKEFLFHVLLIPFARLDDPTTGAFMALAGFSAVVAALLAGAGLRAIGAWGVVLPLLVFAGATDFSLRMVRLRPELLALILILVAIPLASTHRFKTLGIVAALFALGYTAFQTLLGLCGLFFLYEMWVDERAEWRLVVFPALGIALGIAIHPHFPTNLRIWFLQNVEFFLRPAPVDIGAEILPRTTRDTLLLNLGWWLGILVLWRSRVRGSAPVAERRLRDFTLLATVTFGLLYVLMYRFITYAVPLATLALVRSLQVAGERPGPRVRLPFRGDVSIAVPLALCVLAAVYTTQVGAERMAKSASRTFQPGMRADWEGFSRALPDEARVVAPWAATEAFVFWAPQGRYLNVLDPLFMIAKDPEAYRLYLDLLEGREPDVPLLARSRFDSDFYADDGQYPLARRRLLRDPRVVHLHEGTALLYQFVAGRNTAFLVDWKVLPDDAPLPPSLVMLNDPAIENYPRAAGDTERLLEGYVDGRRLGRTSCTTFVRTEEVARQTRLDLEVAPYGRAEVYLDDALAARLPSGSAAVLGAGVLIPLTLEPGIHRLTIRTCPAESQLGFYALVRN